MARWEGHEPLRLAIGINGRAASEPTLAWVRQFGERHPCELLLARVYSPRQEAVRYGLDEPWGELPRESDLLPLLERDLRSQAAAVIADVPVRLRFSAADQHAEEVLAREASSAGVDALVIGVPKHRANGSLSAGAVLRRSTVPVFCVPEGAGLVDRKLPEVRSILIATDLSDASNAVVPNGYGLLRPAGGRVELLTVHVLGAAEDIVGTAAVVPLRPEEKEATAARLRGLAPREAEASGITTKVSVVEARFAVDAIIASAERLDVDLILVGSHGRSGFGRALLGSVAEEVARRSTRPVLIVRAARKKT
jgi:nucleotide-binding universal stress UspA family protein